MSDDSKDSPPAKLTLSRDLKTKVSKSQADTGANSNTAKALPAMKLRRMSDIAQTTDTANAGTGSTDTRIVPPTKPEPSPAAEPPQPAKAKFDPKNPFGGKTAKASVIQSNEIKDPDSPTPTRPSPPPPHTRSQNPSSTKSSVSAAHIEEVIHSLDKEKAPKTQRSSMLPSIVMILILLLVLGGAGFGLWKVLLASNDTENNSGSTTNSTATALPAKPKSNTPIQKAKATIAKVPETDLAAIIGDLPPTPDRNTAKPANIQQSTPYEVLPEQPRLPASNQLIEADKQAASSFLSNIHIGGVRTGERPIIILDGERYNVDDVVHVETDLKFHGLRDGRLAFRDRNGIVYLKSF